MAFMHAGRAIVDWAADVEALADALQIKALAVLGVSAGAAHAEACAWALPDRISFPGVVSGAGPWLTFPNLPMASPTWAAITRLAARDRRCAEQLACALCATI
jgi:pimeloyl-ACP methyl ester carboxylesterase